MRNRLNEYFSKLSAGRTIVHHRQPARPRPMKAFTRYRTKEGVVLFAAITQWGTGKYATFFTGEQGEQKRLDSPFLPPRPDFRQAQEDLDNYAREYELEAV